MSPIKFKEENLQERSIERVRVKEEEESAKGIAEDFNLPYLNLALRPVQHEALEIVPEQEARQANLAVILKKGGALTVAPPFLGGPCNFLITRPGSRPPR